MNTSYKTHNINIRLQTGLIFPDLYLIGFPRSGTTLFFHLIKQNPSFTFYIDRGKYTKFPGIYEIPDLYEFRKNYFLKSKEIKINKIIFDGTVNTYRHYLFYKTLNEYKYKCKFILLIRDPIECFYSYFYIFGIKDYPHLENITSIKNYYNKDEALTELVDMYKFDIHLKRVIDSIDNTDINIFSYYDLVSNKQQEVMNQVYEILNEPVYIHKQINYKVNDFFDARKFWINRTEKTVPKRLEDDYNFLKEIYYPGIEYLKTIKSKTNIETLVFDNYGKIW